MSVMNEMKLKASFVPRAQQIETGCIKIVVPVVMEMLTRVHEKFILFIVLKCHLLADTCHCISCRQFFLR